MAQASRDDNFVTTLLAVSSVDGVTPVTLYANPTTHRLLVDLAGGGSGTVQTISIATANGFAGTSDGNASAPALTLTTSVTGILKGNGTAISAITVGSGLSYDGTTLSATGGGTGTVTSVDMSVPTGLTISGNPVTTSGTLAIGLDTGYVIPLSTSIGNVFKVGTPANNQVGVWTGDGTIEGDAGLTFDTATNTLTIGDVGSGATITVPGTQTLSLSPTGGITLDTGDGSAVDILSNLEIGGGAGNATLRSNGNYDLVLETGNATTGNITITDGASGNITASPNGAGQFIVSGTTTGNTAELVNANAGAVGAYLSCYHNSASPSTSDSNGIEFSGNNTSAAKAVQSAISSGWVDTTAGSEDGYLLLQPTIAGVAYTNGAYLTGTMLGPLTTNVLALGSVNNQWADLFLAEGGVINWDNGDATLTQVGNDVTLAGASLTARVKPRTGTTTSAAQPTINTDDVDFYSITAQTEAITSFTTNLSGTPTDGQKLWIAITGTAARSITWGASFEASTVALPTTTVTTARLDVGFVWNAVTSKWRCIAAA